MSLTEKYAFIAISVDDSILTSPKMSYPMKTRTLYKADGERLNIDRFPCFHVSGSIAGMKKMFYGKNALLVRCGSWIYNVSKEPRIYYKAHWEWNQHHVIVGNVLSSKPKIVVASAIAKSPTTSVVVETNASSDSTEWRDTMQNASCTITRSGDEARSANNLIRSLSAKQWTWQ